MAVLRITDATRSFGSVAALRGVSLELHEGELLGLLGPNGAGKTTLIRAIAGRTRLDSGTIELFGRVLTGTGGRDALGVVPQEVALYPLLTAHENLAAFGSLHGLSGAELKQQVAWALEWTGLAERATALLKTFSGGMKRRLNIACGVLHKPKVVLLDEPTVGVDPQSRERIYDMLEILRKNGASLLLTTHHLEEVEAHCERVAIVDHGRIIAGGSVSELVASTVGVGRRVRVRVDRAPLAPLAGFEQDGEPTVLIGAVNDVVTGLPALLGRVAAAGLHVEDVDVRRPSLQSVFLHLTGKELRE